MGFVDLVNDADANFTIKNQLFFDSMDQYKISEQPGGGKQDVYVIGGQVHGDAPADRDLPDWLDVNTLASVNFRQTKATGYPLRRRLRLAPNRRDARRRHDDAEHHVHPSVRQLRHLERRRAVDEQLRDRVLRSGRRRAVRHRPVHATRTCWSADATTTRTPRTSTSATRSTRRPAPPRIPAVRDRRTVYASGRDTGGSWSVSLSHQLPINIRPYVTVAESSLTLESNNNSMSQRRHPRRATSARRGCARSASRLSLLDDKLFFTTAPTSRRAPA